MDPYSVVLAVLAQAVVVLAWAAPVWAVAAASAWAAAPLQAWAAAVRAAAQAAVATVPAAVVPTTEMVPSAVMLQMAVALIAPLLHQQWMA